MKFLAALLVLAFVAATAAAYDPSPLQDICVAVNNTKDAVFVNGKFCKDPNRAHADDFLFTGLRNLGNTNNQLGLNITPAFVDQFPGLNTLGIAFARVAYAPGGVNPPHTHPRGTEILFLDEGIILAGFVTSDQLGNRLFAKVLYPGDLFLFPIGLIHFQINIGKTNASSVVAFNSQNPGVITIANATFGTQPPINAEVLAKAFQLEPKVVKEIQAMFVSSS